MKISKKLISIVFAFFLALSLTSAALAEELISRPGEYSGYSEQIYDGVKRISQYIEVSDGTRIAVDIHRPLLGGELVTDPLPVVLQSTRYYRFPPQGIIDPENFIKYGYVLAVIDARGTGASYGYRNGPYSPDENQDTKEIIEWLAIQDWCNGTVGMYGSSYMGNSQYATATAAPPSLVSMSPTVGGLDWYSFIYHNGVMNTGFLYGWSASQKAMDLDINLLSSDPLVADGSDPQADHVYNIWPAEISLPDMARDSIHPDLDYAPNIVNSASSYYKEIKKSGIAMYHMGAWNDEFTAEQLAAFKLFGDKIIIAPGDHAYYYWGEGLAFMQTELLRWNDYIIKGIDNGIMDDPPITYATIDIKNPGSPQWKFASEWPLPNQQQMKLYLNGEKSETIPSINDGSLAVQKPKIRSGADDYVVDYNCQVFGGTYNRMMRGNRGDMTENPDMLGLTYTSPPLESDMEMTGHPVAHLWVSSDKPDGYFIVYLEEVDENGVSNYVSDGVIRASHRKTHPKKPWKEMGVPYHRSYEKDIQPLPENGKAVKLSFGLFPTSYIFHAGSRIRVTITGSDDVTYIRPDSLIFGPDDTPPNVKIYREKRHASYITLPIIPQSDDDSKKKMKRRKKK